MSSALLLCADPALCEQSTAALALRKLDVVTVTSLSEGVQCIAEQSLRLMLLDERLGTGGKEGELDALVEECEQADIPIIILGNQADIGSSLARSATVADVVSRSPLDSDILSARVELLLRIKVRLDQLRSQAVVDELTGSYNRRYFDEQMGVRLQEAKRYDTPFSLVMFDLDHFKAVNDSKGHQFGDMVLRETAGLVKKEVRQEDVLARYGGEEFAVMLPHTDRLGSAILAERIRESVADHSFVRKGDSGRVSISLGSASFPIDGVDSVEELIEVCDRRLYQAKHRGRNQTVFE